MESAYKCFIKAVSCPHIETVEYRGDNAAKDVISWNLRRRHLNESQRAMVAAMVAKLPAHRPDNNTENLQTSQYDTAKMLNFSERSVNSDVKL